MSLSFLIWDYSSLFLFDFVVENISNSNVSYKMSFCMWFEIAHNQWQNKYGPFLVCSIFHFYFVLLEVCVDVVHSYLFIQCLFVSDCIRIGIERNLIQLIVRYCNMFGHVKLFVLVIIDILFFFEDNKFNHRDNKCLLNKKLDHEWNHNFPIFAEIPVERKSSW